jgi:site-specific DNA recombinase
MWFAAWNMTSGHWFTSNSNLERLPQLNSAGAQPTRAGRRPHLYPLSSPKELNFMDDLPRIALYARVSSQRQADEATIRSQLAALEQRLAADGLCVDAELRFLDDGFSGTTLQRPALERLRDLIHLGGVERLYVHSPDRLARKFIHQAVLLEEFSKRRVEVVFLNQPPGEASPETNLLVQMQGMFAEYEREKILERTRRGRRFNARQGRVSVLGHAPYGYRYVPKCDGDARYDLVLDEVRVVRDLFRWVGLEGLSVGAAARRLTATRVPTRSGTSYWNRATVRGILLNPAYYGEAHWGKTRLQARLPNQRVSRGRPPIPRREQVARPTATSDQEIIPVPALINRELFDAVAERLAENRQHQRTRQKGPSYLLSGLLMCGRCGSAYCGRRHRRGDRTHVYYHCLGTDKYRHGGESLCDNVGVTADLEAKIWSDACVLLKDPQRLREELQRRQQTSPTPAGDATALRTSITRLKRQLARLLDMYETGYLNKSDFETRAQRVKDRLAREEKTHAEQQKAEQQDQAQATILADFGHFAEEMTKNLDKADFATRRRILELLVKRIEVGADQINIVYKVQLRPFATGPNRGSLQHRLKSQYSASRLNNLSALA